MPPTHFDTDRATFITDLDDCGADFSGEIVRTWNRERGADLTVGEVNTWIETGDPMHEIFERPGFFRNLRPHDGFAEALRGIQDAGVDVVVATAAVGAAAAAEKVEWIREHLPFLSKKNVFIGHRKYMLRGDVFVDDAPHNVTAFRKTNPDAVILVPKFPHNEGLAVDARTVRVEGWWDMANFWATVATLARVRCGR